MMIMILFFNHCTSTLHHDFCRLFMLSCLNRCGNTCFEVLLTTSIYLVGKIFTFCMLGGVPDAGDVAEDPLDIEELESLLAP